MNAASYRMSNLVTFTAWLWTGAFSVLLDGPLNALVVRCVDEYASMRCASNDTVPGGNTISWTYDGKTVINSPCNAVTSVFNARSQSPMECTINASLTEARNDPYTRIISGLYGCTDGTSDGMAATAMAIILGRHAL